jgi:uncharacterized protein
MNPERPLCVIFDTPSGPFAYDAASNHILRLDDPGRRLLEELTGTGGGSPPLTGQEREDALSGLAKARKSGILVPAAPEIVTFDEEFIRTARHELDVSGPQHVIIGVTERCNFRCRYCAYSGAYEDHRLHSGRSMSQETLAHVLDWYLSHPERAVFSMGFYGGEPLLELDLIRHAAAEAKRRARTLKLHITTNASLMTPPIARFLADNGFHVTVSLDGPPDVHDRYRRLINGAGTFDLTWRGVQLLRQSDPEWFGSHVAFNAVAAPPYGISRVRDFTLEHPDVFTRARLSMTGLSPYPSELPEELRHRPDDESLQKERAELFAILKAQLAKGPPETEDLIHPMFLSDLEVLHHRPLTPLPGRIRLGGQCTPGLAKAYIGVDGDIHFCERLPGTRAIGLVPGGVDADAVAAFLKDYSDYVSPRCTGCWAVRFCNKCFLDFGHGENFSQERFATHCQRTRKRWLWNLARYAELVSENPTALDWLPHGEAFKEPLQ